MRSATTSSALGAAARTKDRKPGIAHAAHEGLLRKRGRCVHLRHIGGDLRCAVLYTAVRYSRAVRRRAGAGTSLWYYYAGAHWVRRDRMHVIQRACPESADMKRAGLSTFKPLAALRIYYTQLNPCRHSVATVYYSLHFDCTAPTAAQLRRAES
eukprot:IDg12227t1